MYQNGGGAEVRPERRPRPTPAQQGPHSEVEADRVPSQMSGNFPQIPQLNTGLPNTAGGDFNGLSLPLMDSNAMPMGMDLDMLGTDDGNSIHGGSMNGGFTPFLSQAQALQQSGLPTSSTPGGGSDGLALAMGGDSAMTGAGAGPLPTGFGAPSMNPSGSTLTEFTKRRNWSQRVLEELRDLMHILTPNGRILYVSPSCKNLTGWEPQQLMGRFINDFIHPEDIGIFVKEFNESIASGNSLRFFYRFRKADESWGIFESHGHPHLSSDPSSFAPPNALNCRGFFIMARPYPTKNAALLDSFLEHKIENERLTKRIAELKREEQEEQDEWSKKDPQSQSGAPTESVVTQSVNPSDAASYAQMPPPAKPSISNTALTRQNLDEVLAASRIENISDKMARYEGANHLETIEMLTGLRYRDGERSQGISTGDASPMLIRGDAGIQISLDRDGRGTSDKKKKLKLADEYVCTDCGTLDSPEWRKGPNGPKTLCNACGLRWAKKEKKRANSNTPGNHSTSTPGLPMHQSTGSS
ncbi:white collar 2 type of transcription factor [Didymella pomorum]|uniref:White collar 2 type of transcription factor n=1 Tax=Didymella pomorum TaxID=749634 RepID=A0A9W9D729_9PLEO|nr:white collar 2 type of transcription factor [Didymella pomorum]